MQQEQKWIDPTPASLLLVFCITMTLWAVFTGMIGMNAMPVIGSYFLTFGVLWLMAAAICFTYFTTQGATLDARADGYFLLFTGIIFLIFTLCGGKRLGLIFWLLLSLGVGFILLGLGMAGILGLWAFPIGGWLMLVGGLISLYTGGSMIINFSFGRPVLPLGGPMY
jgi:succinate-acetate transporter protein